MDSRPPLTDDVILIADGLRRGLDRILGTTVASLFLYGAVAFPRPERWKIDFDFHVLLERLLVATERAAIADLYAGLRSVSELGSDLDGYFVLLADASQSESPRHQLDLRIRDEAWALHRAHIHAGRYFLIAGVDPVKIVPKPTWSELEAGLREEIEFVVTHPDATAFGILNAARIVCSVRTNNVVMSKYQAAEWALATLPVQLHDAVRAATRSYTQDSQDGDELLLRTMWWPFVELANRALD